MVQGHREGLGGGVPGHIAVLQKWECLVGGMLRHNGVLQKWDVGGGGIVSTQCSAARKGGHVGT
jgi:hypothetical protein